MVNIKKLLKSNQQRHDDKVVFLLGIAGQAILQRIPTPGSGPSHLSKTEDPKYPF